MSTVWKESSAQARDMVSTFTASPEENIGCETHGETDQVVEGVRRIAINVIGSVGFGRVHPWTQIISKADAPAGYKLSFMEATLAIVNNIIVAVFVSPSILQLSFMPRALQDLGAARTEFPRYAKGLIAKERSSPGTADTGNTLISALVNVADDQKRRSVTPTKRSLCLSDDEITGNLFNFTIAGFDTTASVTAYALIALAIEPEWQDWIIEEIDRVAQICADGEYEKSFPLLKRCLALMVCLSSNLPVCTG